MTIAEKGTYGQLPDAELVDVINNGETSAFEILIRRYNPSLYKLGRSFRLGHQDVQDLMQDTFIQAFRNLAKLQNKGYFKTWLMKIMVHECYRKCQKVANQSHLASGALLLKESIPMLSGGRSGDTEIKVTGRELNAHIENAISLIPEGYRLVFLLRELNGMTVQETAKALLISEANVKVRLNRAKVMLRKEIEKIYNPDEIYHFNLIYCSQVVDNVMRKL